jgi:hypothetical protein
MRKEVWDEEAKAYKPAAEDETMGFMCAVLDKDLRAIVHGEQHLVKLPE